MERGRKAPGRKKKFAKGSERKKRRPGPARQQSIKERGASDLDFGFGDFDTGFDRAMEIAKDPNILDEDIAVEHIEALFGLPSDMRPEPGELSELQKGAYLASVVAWNWDVKRDSPTLEDVHEMWNLEQAWSLREGLPKLFDLPKQLVDVGETGKPMDDSKFRDFGLTLTYDGKVFTAEQFLEHQRIRRKEIVEKKRHPKGRRIPEEK